MTTSGAVLFFLGCGRGENKISGQSYSEKKIANINDLKINEPISFNYPDDKSPCMVVKLGKEAIGGIGKEKDIVAFSTLCTHMGCPANYSKGRLVCKCHYTMFDVSRNGQSYQGLASQWIPQITLRHDTGTGNIYAEGVEGLIYGRIGNLKIS